MQVLELTGYIYEFGVQVTHYVPCQQVLLPVLSGSSTAGQNLYDLIRGLREVVGSRRDGMFQPADHLGNADS